MIDSDASQFLFPPNEDYYSRFNAYLRSTVGTQNTIDGTKILWNGTINPATLRSPTEPKKEGYENSETLFLFDPLTIFDISKINLSATDTTAKINSFMRVGVLIASLLLYYSNKDKLSVTSILLGIILALILFNSLKMEKESLEVSYLDKNPYNPVKFQPRDLDNSAALLHRSMTSGLRDGIRRGGGYSEYAQSMIKY